MKHHYYMDIALQEAKKAGDLGEIPVGAVIVLEDQVIAAAHNLREATKDPTAHAEILAIRQAAKVLNTWRLKDCTLYVTLEPCPMCAGAIVQARVKTLVYGINDFKTGAVGSVLNLVQHKAFNHQVEVIAGIREDETKKILQSFFEKKR